MGPERLVVLEYHTKDQWAFRETEALYSSYDVEGTPSVFFDGKNGVAGGSDASYLYARYKRITEKELTARELLTLSAARASDIIPGIINVKLTNISEETFTDLQLIGVAYQDFGTERHHFLVSDISAVNVPEIRPGDSLELEISFETQASLLNTVLFVKSVTGQIIQGTRLAGTSQIWLP